MKVKARFFIATILMVLLCLSSTYATDERATVSGPKLFIKERSFDFGQVKEGSSAEHTFRVQNKGDQVLQIKKVKPT